MTNNARDLAIHLTEVHAISERDLLIACLKYMSTDEVADMLDANELLTPSMERDGWLQKNYGINKHTVISEREKHQSLKDAVDNLRENNWVIPNKSREQ